MLKFTEIENPSKRRPLPEDATQKEADTAPLAPEDFYYEGSNLVFTAAYHRKRGYCCNSGCRHCPFDRPSIDD
ncbi:MAG TPA: DUF5522 domain-containing protein [Acidobacteriaceae bacterium]